MKPQRQESQQMFTTDSDFSEKDLMSGVQLLHRFSPAGKATVWLIDYQTKKTSELSIPAGKYTLLTVPDTETGSISCAARLCTLEENPAIVTVQALSQVGDKNHIWLQPIACTLNDLLAEIETLTPGQTSWLAEQLAPGLEFLHQHDMSYTEITPKTCAFTKDLTAQLLLPQIDTRGYQESKIQEQHSTDIQKFAQLLWLCLVGSDAPQQQHRLPLNVVLPNISTATAKLFEKALDGAEDAPDPVELAMALKQDAAPEAPQIHLAAPQATRGTIKPLANVATREQHERLSHKRKPKTSATKGPKKKKRSASQGTNTRPKILLAGVAALGICALVVTLWHQAPQEINSEQTVAVQEQTVEPEKAVADNDVVAIVEQTLTKRNTTLATGALETISDYAVDGSEIAQNDTAILQKNSETRTDAGLLLAEIHDYRQENNTYTVIATVKANKAIEGSAETDRVYMQDGVPHQKVELIFQKIGESWLLEKATPLASDGS